MSEIQKTEIVLENGRKAEKVVVQDSNDKVVTEVWMAPIERKLSKRITEFKKSIIHRREIEVVDDNGNVVDKVVESLDAEPELHSAKQIHASAPVPGSGIFTVKSQSGDVLFSVNEPKANVSMQSLVKERIEDAASNKIDVVGMGLWALIALLITGFVYVTFVI